MVGRVVQMSRRQHSEYHAAPALLCEVLLPSALVTCNDQTKHHTYMHGRAARLHTSMFVAS
jgi:hypothetical protein